MQIIRTIGDLDPALSPWRQAGEKIALVPTMGALHAGHLALVAAARARADKVVASIFVNPLQFNDQGDLARYPRQEAADSAMLEAAGCDLVWLPTSDQLYPDGFATTVSVGGISERWEGAHRPGHFDGVATVVAKLFIATLPDAAIFGEKDWQQLAVIRRMSGDLGLPIDIIGHPTVRECDGLAMSSRNALLSPVDRARAVVLPEAMKSAVDDMRSGAAISDALTAAERRLQEAGFRVDYIALVDAATLEPVDEIVDETRLIAAATIGTTRLIDNTAV